MIKYWKDVDILDIELKEGKYEYSEEIAEGVILDQDGKSEEEREKKKSGQKQEG